MEDQEKVCVAVSLFLLCVCNFYESSKGIKDYMTSSDDVFYFDLFY